MTTRLEQFRGYFLVLSHRTKGVRLNIFHLEHYPSPLAVDPIVLENVLSNGSRVINEWNETRRDYVCI